MCCKLLSKGCPAAFALFALCLTVRGQGEVTLVPGGCRGLFLPDETPELTLVVSNRSDREMSVAVSLRTIDYFGKVVKTGDEHLTIAAGDVGRKVLTYRELDRLGYYCTVADWKSEQASGMVEGSFVRVGPQLERPDKLFGISCFCVTDVEVFKRMGVGTKGMSFSWDGLENKKRPGPEHCDFSRTKALVRKLREAGIRVFGMVDAADSGVPRRYFKETVEKRQDPIADVPTFYADIRTFYRNLAAALKDDVSEWSAGIEIDLAVPSKPYIYERHIDLVHLFSQAVKSVNPEAVVLGISVSGGDGRSTPRFPCTKKLLPRLADCLDGLSPDQYTAGQDYGEGYANLNSEEADLRGIMQEVIALADQYGLKRIAIDEKGPAFVRSTPLASPLGTLAANVVARDFIILKTLPRVDHWLYFRPFNWNDKARFDWGMWERQNPRQVVAAYAATARLMAHAEFVKEVPVHESVPCWAFRKDGRFFATLWSNGEKPLSFRLNGKPADVRDAMGNPVNAVDGLLKLDASPTYVSFGTLADLESAIGGAAYDIPAFSAMVEKTAADRMALHLRNKSRERISVSVANFGPSTLPEELKGTFSLGPQETRTVEFASAANDVRIELSSGKGEPLTVSAAFDPVCVRRISGWDDLVTAQPVRLDDPIAQMPGYADLKSHGLYEGPDDLSAEARFGYDDEALYMEYRVRDDLQRNKSVPSRVFVGDCVQFAVDAENDARANLFAGRRGFDDDDYNCVAGLADGVPTLWCYASAEANRARLEGKAMQTPAIERDDRTGTTCYRIRLPFADLAPLRPDRGRVFGMSFMLFDYDLPSSGLCLMQLTPGVGTPNDPSKFRRFVFESGTYDVRDFGARGDGVSKDTAAIQRAVDAAEKDGGGRVRLGPGTYLSGSVFLKDNVELHLEAGATLRGSPDRADYNATDVCPQNRPSQHECHTGGHLVLAIEKKNVSITGSGRIDGNGPVFLADKDGNNIYMDPEIWELNIPWRPAQMLYFVESENIRIEDISLIDSPYWNCYLHGCTHVTVKGVRIRNRRYPLHTHNGDGIDIDCCRDVEVSDCDIDSADDCITFRACTSSLSAPRPCEDIRVSRCRLSTPCNALRFGVGKGVVRNVSVRDVEVWDSRTAVNFVSGWNEESAVDFENISIEGLEVDARSLCRCYPAKARSGRLRNVRLARVRGTAPLDVAVCCLPIHSYGDVLFEDVDVEAKLVTFGVENLRIVGGRLQKKDLSAAELAEYMSKAETEAVYPGKIGMGGTRRGSRFVGGSVKMPAEIRRAASGSSRQEIEKAVREGVDKIILRVEPTAAGELVLASDGVSRESVSLDAALDLIPDGGIWIDLTCPVTPETVESVRDKVVRRGRLHQTRILPSK